MGVDYTSYAGFGIKIADSKTFDEVYHNKLEPLDYIWESDDNFFKDKHIELITDGMCGDYIYLMYVIDRHDLYDETEGISIDLDEFKKQVDEVKPLIEDAINKLGLSDMVSADNIKFITFTHAW